MEDTGKSLEEMYANMILEDEEDRGVTFSKEIVKDTSPKYVLVGKFLTEKNINFIAMQNVMTSLWRPKEGMEVHDLGNFRYSFIFYHMMDLHKVLEGGMWMFEQSMLIYHRLLDNEDPYMVQLQEAGMWVQIYDIPKGFISETVLKSVGDSFGCYLKSNPVNFNNIWKDHVRIRVTMNVAKSIKRRMKLKRDSNNWNWINFKYERLSSFCFIYGIIGHSERDYGVVYANPEKIVDVHMGLN
ncbi:uncharacterized protein LOC141660010 [Apium graveolens]|uniref:uncharacterized protein LOC141660010 n=1 Tax=Apium graveolens TaxID=4045 RepID=UPI003D7B8BA4